MMMDQENGTPDGWKKVKLGDVVIVLDNKRIPINAKERAGRVGNTPYYGATGQVGWIDDYLFDEELVLLGEDGAPFLDPSKSKAYIVRGKSWVNNHAHVLKAKSNSLNTYIKYYLDIVNYKDFVTGTTRFKLNQSAMHRIPVPIAPLPEQHRIVAEIEKQFSRLDEAVAGLKRIQANLKRYRASVLKAAVEGKLTAEWRKQHPDIEPAQQLLERILKERRAHWEQAELEKMQAAGKPPKDDKWKQKYKEPVAPDVPDLPALPEGWIWARLDTIASLKGGITVDKNKFSSDFIKVPYLRVANVQRGYLDLTEIKEILAPKQKIDQLLLKRNDILFNEGGDLDKLGRGWIWEDQLTECIHQNHVFRARLFILNVEAKLVSWWGNTFGRDYFLREGKQTTNLASINLTKLSGFPVPLPSQDEQAQIVSEVERRLSIADEVEQQININLKRAERLRQAILKKAFCGTLVPQDPDDEPASVLLEKIKQAQCA